MPSELQGHASDLLKEGGKGAIANYFYDTFVGPKIAGTVGQFAGNWTDAVISFGAGLALRRYWHNPSAKNVAYSLFAHRLSIALEGQFPSLGGVMGSPASSGYSPLAPIKLA